MKEFKCFYAVHVVEMRTELKILENVQINPILGYGRSFVRSRLLKLLDENCKLDVCLQ